MMSLLRHADRVAIACLAQLVNVIAPIRAEPGRAAWRQTTFYPFALTARHAVGDVLRVEPVSPVYATAQHGDVPVTDVVATWDPETGNTTVFAVNRHQDQPVEVRLDVRALGATAVAEHVYLGGSDLGLANTAAVPDRVAPRTGSGARIDGGTCTVVLPPVSWTMVRLNSGR
jgi:alpha-N-arabinofuranosidase